MNLSEATAERHLEVTALHSLESQLPAERPTPDLDARPEPEWAPAELVEACRRALHRIGGPTLSPLGVASCLRGEGRTTVALAAALVQRYSYDRTTVLAEMDLDNPTLAERLDLKGAPGVWEVATGQASLAEAIQWVDDRLAVLVAGDAGAGTAGLLARPETIDLLDRLGSLGPSLGEVATRDAVVADLPPLPPEGPGLALANGCEKLLLVVRAGVTPVPTVERAVANLDSPPAVFLNATTTKVPRWIRRMMGTAR